MTSIVTSEIKNRLLITFSVAVIGGALLFSSIPATAQISGVGTAVIDGTLSAGEWDGAGTVIFDINLPDGGGTTPGTLYIMNDADNLYMALSFARMGLDLGNSFTVEFDNDGSGFLSDGDDGFVVNPGSAPQLSDNFRALGISPACPVVGLCGPADTADGGTNDGEGIGVNDGFNTIYEVSKPLDSADDTHDFSLMAGETIGYFVSVRIFNAMCCTDTNFPGFGVFTESLQIAEAGPVVPGDDVVVLLGALNQPVTAVVQEVVLPGTITPTSCSFEVDPWLPPHVRIDVIQEINNDPACANVAAELEPGDEAKLRRYQRGFVDPADGKTKIGVTIIRSRNLAGEQADLTKGVVVSEEDAAQLGITEPGCNVANVSDSPSTVAVDLSTGDLFAGNQTGTCNRPRSFGHFSDKLVIFPVKYLSAILSPRRQVALEASHFRRAVRVELRAGCVDRRFLRVLRAKFNWAMFKVQFHNIPRGIDALNHTALFALQREWEDCPNDPKGNLISAVMDLTYQIHRGMLFPNQFVEFEIDPAILAELPPFPTDPPVIPPIP